MCARARVCVRVLAFLFTLISILPIFLQAASIAHLAFIFISIFTVWNRRRLQTMWSHDDVCIHKTMHIYTCVYVRYSQRVHFRFTDCNVLLLLLCVVMIWRRWRWWCWSWARLKHWRHEYVSLRAFSWWWFCCFYFLQKCTYQPHMMRWKYAAHAHDKLHTVFISVQACIASHSIAHKHIVISVCFFFSNFMRGQFCVGSGAWNFTQTACSIAKYMCVKRLYVCI